MERRRDRGKMRWSLFFLACFYLHAVDCQDEKKTLFRHPTQFIGEGREHKELPENYWKIHSTPTVIWLGQPHHHHTSPKSLFNRHRRKRQVEEDGNWPKEKIENQPTLFSDKDDYDSFFRNEYYRILAQSFASSRKKREVRKKAKETKIIDHLFSSQQKLNDAEKRVTKKHNSIAMHIDANNNKNLWNEYDAPEESGIVQPQNAGFRPLPGFSANPVSNSDLPFGKWKFFDDEKYEQECPPLHLLAKECSTLGGIMPEGNLKNILLRACNWLEICYSCGNNNDLQPDDCDTGFLYGIRFVCEGDVPCQATGRLLLLSLRQTGASQRSLSSICSADQCIEQFLFQLSA